jgi:protoporphyrinogen/coproporphyrinogen III oxidase
MDRFPPRDRGCVTIWHRGGVGTGEQGRHVVVVGGGIAGLAAAFFLRQASPTGARSAVTVLEASPVVGGKLRLGEVGGIYLDLGAEALLARRPEAVELIQAVGLGDEVIHPHTTAAAIWSHGELHPIPAGQVMGVPADITAIVGSGLLSRAGAARLPLDHVLPRTRIDEDTSAGAYVSSRLGREVVDRLVEPILGGVYAGRADMLSFSATMPDLAAAARERRSLIEAARHVRSTAVQTGNGPVFIGLPGGVGRLAVAVAEASGAEIRTGVTVRALRRTPAGWVLTAGSARAPEAITADAVVIAVPARPAARLLDAELPAVAAELASIDYASVALVTLAYPHAAFGGVRTGSGFLVPPIEGRIAKGVTFSSEKWQWVAAAEPGTIVVRVSIGRYGEEQDLQRDDAELVKLAAGELRELAGVRGTPADASVTRWGGGLPQYAVGHLGRVRRIRDGVAAVPGLVLCGAAYDGVGVPACIATARLAAESVINELSSVHRVER